LLFWVTLLVAWRAVTGYAIGRFSFGDGIATIAGGEIVDGSGF
jgi:hypothetical protein